MLELHCLSTVKGKTILNLGYFPEKAAFFWFGFVGKMYLLKEKLSWTLRGLTGFPVELFWAFAALCVRCHVGAE